MSGTGPADAPHAQRPGRRRLHRATLVAVALVLAWGGGELGAWLFLRATEGEDATPSVLASQRAGLARGEPVPDALAPGSAPTLLEGGAAVRALHPFLGFVRDGSAPPPRMGGLDFEIDRHGFVQRAGRDVGDSPRAVFVVGGSVALLFNLLAGPELADQLAGDPRWPEAPEVVNLSVGAWKQPQQLMALNWMLALGRRPAAVILIDGFNEVALSSARASKGLDPLFPVDWEALTSQTLDLELAVRLGRLEVARERRRELARRLSSRAFSHSPLLNLLWRRLDRVAAREIDLARQALEEREAAETGRSERSEGDQDRLAAEVAAVWRRSSLQMHRLCQAQGIDYYHFLQPNQYVPGSKPMGAAERKRVWRPDHHYRISVERGYPLLAREGEALREQGVAFYDLTGLFADTPEPTYSDACCHLNRLGNRLLARRIAEAIRGR